MHGTGSLEAWTRKTSPLHERDARMKLAALLIVLIAIATTPPERVPAFAGYAVLLLGAILLARLPLTGVCLRAALVLPFAGTAALVIALSAGWFMAAIVVCRSYLSAVAVVVIAGTTTAPALLRALRTFGCPRVLVLVVQFIYRFLLLTGEQAQRLRTASLARQGLGKNRRSLASAAAGTLAVMFASAYARAERVHRAMLARGFDGEIRLLRPRPAVAADWMFLLAAAGFALAIRSG